MSNVTVSHTCRLPYPKLPYDAIKNDILGKSYQLDLNFIGAVRAKKLNQTYRRKSYVPNVLSFPLAADTGEVYITPAVTRYEAKKFSMTKTGYIGFLFIHACLHLKGHDHGATMEAQEQRYCKKYQLR